MADDAGESPDVVGEPDPARNYPWGNRLGLRHPRPTVVIVVAVLVVLAGAFVWRLVQPPRATFCEVTAATGTPTAADADAALRAWYDAYVERAPKDGPDAPPPFDTYVPVGGDVWEHVVDDHELVKVEVGDVDGTYRVIAVNRCRYGPASDFDAGP